MERQRYNIHLPPIRDDLAGYKYLARLTEAVLSEPQHYFVFNFSKCSVISHNGIAVIGGLCNYLKQHRLATRRGILSIFPKLLPFDSVGFDFSTMNQKIMKRLRDVGFWNYVHPAFGIERGADYIGYREHAEVLEDSLILDHLQDKWLSDEKLSLSAALKGVIVSSIYEIFVNAYGHGLKDNPNGQSVISCGYYEPKSKKLSLSVFDLGSGIVGSVQRLYPDMDGKTAIAWALEMGNSTRTDSPADMPRGLGFGILKKFVALNGGTLTVCSDEFMASIDSRSDYVVQRVPGKLLGTLVSITVNCDDKHYKFKSEIVEDVPAYF